MAEAKNNNNSKKSSGSKSKSHGGNSQSAGGANTEREQLLEYFASNTAELGITEDNLKISTASISGAPDDYYLLLFPEGLGEVVKELEKRDDLKAIEQVAEREDLTRTTEKIYAALETKILARSQEVAHAFSKFYSNPKYTPLGFKTAWNTASEIWYFAGDNSTDFNYYTKRSLLSSVYIKSCLFYIQDSSEGFSETKRFISDSLDRIVAMGKTIGTIKTKFPKMENIPFLRLFS
jgi:ubiquinone biosynthesis protein COQ9